MTERVLGPLPFVTLTTHQMMTVVEEMHNYTCT